MNSYIDKDKLSSTLTKAIELCEKMGSDTHSRSRMQYAQALQRVNAVVKEQPAADVQPIVHCKNCWKRGTEHCSVNMPYKDKLIIAKVDDDFFCKGGDKHEKTV